MDIRYISQQLRTLKLIANVLLTKFQRDLIPHFKDNLVKLGDLRKQNISYAEINESKLQESLWITFKESASSKLNQRILKNIDDEISADSIMNFHKALSIVGPMQRIS